MESSPSDTKGSAARTPTTEDSTLSPFHLIMKIRRDLARALQGLPGASLPSSSASVDLHLVHRFPSFSVPTRTHWKEQGRGAEE